MLSPQNIIETNVPKHANNVIVPKFLKKKLLFRLSAL